MPRGARRLAVVLGLLFAGACAESPTAPATGTLDVSVTGLPGGAAGDILVSGPRGFTTVLTATQRLTGLVPGRYELRPRIVPVGEDLFAPLPNAPVVQMVQPGRVATVSFAHALYSGSVSFLVTGLPDGLPASAILTRNGFPAETLAIPGAKRGVFPGAWTVTFPDAAAPDGHRYAAQTMPLAIESSPVTKLALVDFDLQTGALRVTFRGLPPGARPAADLIGPGGSAIPLGADTTRVLAPGDWLVRPRPVVHEGIRFGARDAARRVTTGLSPLDLFVDYTSETGRLIVDAVDVPPGAAAPTIGITGPDGDLRSAAPGDTLDSLTVGRYVITGTPVIVALDTFVTPADTVDLDAGEVRRVTLAYAPRPVFNLALDAAYAVQAIQRIDGGVPLVAGRPALVRVFATANLPNTHRLPVRVRLRVGPTVLFEQRVDANADGIPLSVNQGSLTGAWAVDVPGTAIVPGATLDVALDPDSTIGERARGDNAFSAALDVRPLPTFRGRFVPIRFGGNPAPTLDSAATASYLQLSRALLPLHSLDVDIRSAYVTALPPLATSNGEVWGDLLAELDAVRVLEGGDRYYMGIVPVSYDAGIAGIAYLGRPTSLTWAYLPSGSEVLAHELGHNFDRRHAPCGGPDGVDPAYPYPDADIGAFGWDATRRRLRAPTVADIMSYCNDPWVSDYTWEGVLSYREDEAAAVSAARGGWQREPAVLVWGSVGPGGIRLEPAFEVEALPALPTGGPLRLELRDAQGRALYTATFRATEIPHASPAGTAHFAFAIPRRLLAAGSIATMRVRRGAQVAERRVATEPALRLAPSVQALRTPDGGVRLTHSDAATAAMLLRDATSGRILSIVRGRSVTLPPTDGPLEVLASDGLRTHTLRITPPPR
jgi:hypothetical protein